MEAWEFQMLTLEIYGIEKSDSHKDDRDNGMNME
jgi:hypothetical protein